MRISELLPAPFCPSTTVFCPFSMLKFTFCSIFCEPKAFVMSFKIIKFILLDELFKAVVKFQRVVVTHVDTAPAKRAVAAHETKFFFIFVVACFSIFLRDL